MDSFIFAAPLDAATNVDTITDFAHDVDTIRLDDAVFAGLPTGPLEAKAFARTTDISEGDDRVIYDQMTGNLFFDDDGGLRVDAILFATLDNRPANLDATDFVVI